MLERKFQSQVIAELKARYPGAVILKNDASYIQGIPDVLALYGPHWAMFECKKSVHEHRQPNQEYYVDLLDRMSFARFIYPENKEIVFDELQYAFQS